MHYFKKHTKRFLIRLAIGICLVFKLFNALGLPSQRFIKSCGFQSKISEHFSGLFIFLTRVVFVVLKRLLEKIIIYPEYKFLTCLQI